MVGILNGFGFLFLIPLDHDKLFLFTGIDMCRVSMSFVMGEMFLRIVVLRIVEKGYVYLETNNNKKYGTGWKNIKEGYFIVVKKP